MKQSEGRRQRSIEYQDSEDDFGFEAEAEPGILDCVLAPAEADQRWPKYKDTAEGEVQGKDMEGMKGT